KFTGHIAAAASTSDAGAHREIVRCRGARTPSGGGRINEPLPARFRASLRMRNGSHLLPPAPVTDPRQPQWLRQTHVWRGVTSLHESQKRLKSVKSATRGG